MLEWTDRHCRYFLRQLSRHCLLYTEMVTAAALLRGNPARLLQFDAAEHPLALQLGGSDPAELAAAARIGEDFGYDEINLNLGCPSDRVQSGRFGACLMAEPEHSAACVAALRAAVGVPVTVKTRIGIDDQDSYDFLHRFIDHLQAAGCETVILHARKAILRGLSPKQNRSIPPLDYAMVYRIKADFPALEIILNGGVTTLEAAARHLDHVDGVMIGRAAYHNPYLLAGVDGRLHGSSQVPPTREQVLERMLPYMRRELENGTALKHITRHMLGLYHGMPGARVWRRHLSARDEASAAGIEVLQQALDEMTRTNIAKDATCRKQARMTRQFPHTGSAPFATGRRRGE
jgi:tRNA-dihydrouridine synthase A